MGWGDDIPTPQNMRGYRLAVFTQLRQAIEAMHNPEEMFQWLSSMIMQRFDVPIVQVWTCENGWTGQPSARLRAMASQNPSQPLQVLSEKAADAVERIAKGQRITSPVPVERIFPAYLASLLKRYGLGICFYCLNSKSVDFAPEGNAPLQGRSATGLTFIVLLLLQQYPQQDLASAVTIILEQALAIAENRHLLLPVTAVPGRISAPYQALAQDTPPALPGLIIRKKQNAGLMLSSNPFASSITITDKQALRLYEAIDGRTPVAELSALTGMTLQEAQAALQTLLGLQCVEIYTPEGWPVDTSLLFKNH
ncbi:MAG TPA: hypothetical protein VIZ18_00855 [Ktedonobacteraceae bacterium]